ncbi:MAG: N-acetylmuramic acid 6-phosphate etherase [Planctomycetes bacterium]|jgi:N-acetylmuramic acid 6-phosphate etherase|nr:N-acetylmuramic acid 6-phosphate etherase [Planctomycetota bacterium]MDP6409421.1 N-acetylmuramic acid 6-phosphate etherase [Planctomycetota bacterium]
MSDLPPSRAHLDTERAHPASAGLDRMSVAAAFDCMNALDAGIATAVAAAREDIVAVIELVRERLSAGGRLVYVGAGTSGRLAVLDAVECPPTFQSDPERVQAVIAGGAAALTGAVEGAEDERDGARAELDARGIGRGDVVFGISAGGTTPFVEGALDHARTRGAATVFFACVSSAEVPDRADFSIRVLTGPEALAGSTRLKAGTATKLVLNAVSTLAMAGLGKVYGNRMVDVNTLSNVKLRDRGIRLVCELCDLDRAQAARQLDRARGSVKLAVLMERHDLDPGPARERLAAAGGDLSRALA